MRGGEMRCEEGKSCADFGCGQTREKVSEWEGMIVFF